VVDLEIRKKYPKARIPDADESFRGPITSKYDEYAAKKLGRGRYFEVAKPVSDRYWEFEQSRKSEVRSCEDRLRALALDIPLKPGTEWREVASKWYLDFSSQVDPDSYARVAMECHALAAIAKGTPWRVEGVLGGIYTFEAKVSDDVDLDILRMYPLPIDDVVVLVRKRGLNPFVYPGIRS